MHKDKKFEKVYSSIKDAEDYVKNFVTNYSLNFVLEAIEAVNNMKVLVVGETIIDQYDYGRVIGKSGKEPILAFKSGRMEKYAGGVLNIANHLIHFCKNITVFTMLGEENSQIDFVKNSLDDKIKLDVFYKKNSSTIVKEREVDDYHIIKLFEKYYINDEDIDEEQSKQVAKHLSESLPDYDLVICADFGHSMLDERIRSTLSRSSNFLALNTQANAGNFGYHTISKYQTADYICLAEPEARLEARDKTGNIEKIIAKIAEKLDCNKLIVTRSKHGCLAYDDGKFFKCPSFADKSVDRMGAGDAFLTITSPLVRNNIPLDVVNLVGNTMGALAINIVGNKESIKKELLYDFIEYILT